MKLPSLRWLLSATGRFAGVPAGLVLATAAAQAALSFHVDLDGDAGDRVGANDLELGTGASFVSGRFGQALEFDGSEQAFARRVNPTGLPQGDASRTLSLWVHYTVVPEDTVFGSYGNNLNGALFGIGESYASTESLMAYFWNSSYDREIGPAPNPVVQQTGVWQLHLLSYDSVNDQLIHYVNGVPSGIVPTGPSFQLQTSLAELTLAEVAGTPTNRRQFEGRVDDFSIWDEVLMPAQARLLHSAGDTGPGGLGYDAGQVNELFSFYEGQSGGVIGPHHWSYVASGLDGEEGEVQRDGSNYVVLIDGTTGAGLVAMPEAGTPLLLLVSMLGLLRRRRQP